MPTVDPSAYVAPGAWVTGRTTLGADVTILFGAVLRGDLEPVSVGRGSNVQDNAVLHTTLGGPACVVGEGVVIGHGAVLHSCTVGDGALVGMRAVVLDGAVIGPGSMVGAGAVVTPGTVVPAGHLAVGTPARVVRPLAEGEIRGIGDVAVRYVTVGKTYRDETG